MSTETFSIKNADMPEEMRKDIVRICLEAVKQHKIEKDIAGHIKKECDQKHLPSWQCIVGKNFGSYVTHESGYFVYMYAGGNAILLYKAG
ncbi:unnamed protein product [Heterobilharzia americana]|nr:unnamed protein product [Heterobilharzia americana]